MSPEIKMLVAYRLEQSAQSFEDAKDLLDRGSYRGATNRLYYACFYAVSALLVERGLSTKRHSGAKSMFIEHFVRPGPFPPECGRFYSKLLAKRENLDYEDFSEIQESEVIEMLETAKEFIAVIRQYLENLMKEQES